MNYGALLFIAAVLALSGRHIYRDWKFSRTAEGKRQADREEKGY